MDSLSISHIEVQYLAVSPCAILTSKSPEIEAFFTPASDPIQPPKALCAFIRSSLPNEASETRSEGGLD